MAQAFVREKEKESALRVQRAHEQIFSICIPAPVGGQKRLSLRIWTVRQFEMHSGVWEFLRRWGVWYYDVYLTVF